MRPDSPSDPALKTLELASGPVRYTDAGQGPVLIACHGCPGSVRDWRWMGPILEQSVRLIRLDLPAFGETPLTTWADASNRGRARFVLAVANALGIDRFALMAHSAGGPMCLELAAEHPDRVTAVAFLGVPGLRPHRPLREAPFAHAIARVLWVPGLRQILTVLLRRGFEKSGFPRGLPGDALRQSMRVVHAFDFDRQGVNAARVQVPVLHAWTEDDRFIEREISEELAAALPTVTPLPFPEGGHYLQKTRATEISEAIVELLTTASTDDRPGAGARTPA